MIKSNPVDLWTETFEFPKVNKGVLMASKVSAIPTKKKSAQVTLVTPSELDEIVTGIESDLRKHFQKKREDPERPIVKELISHTSAALRDVLGA